MEATTDLVKFIKNQHTEEAQSIKTIENLFEQARNSLKNEDLEKLNQYLKGLYKHLDEHFYVEESKLFPRLKNDENQQLIFQLEKEHVKILDLIKTANTIIEKINKGNKNLWMELRYNVKELLHELNDHILKEDYILLKVFQAKRREATIATAPIPIPIAE